MNDLLSLCKQCLSIVSSATLKDNEITMLINAAILDMSRQGISVDEDTDNDLKKAAIVMFVKGNFGSTDLKEKELAQKTYSLLCCNLGLSAEYRESENDV